MDLIKQKQTLETSVQNRNLIHNDLLCKIENTRKIVSGYVEMEYEEIADRDIEEILIKVGEKYTVIKDIGIAKDIDSDLKIPEHTVWLMHCKKGIRIDKHSHPNIEYFLVITGEIIVNYYDNEGVRIKKNSVKNMQTFCIKEKTFHSIEFGKDTSFVIVWHPKL